MPDSRKLMGRVYDYLVAIKQAKGIVDAIKRILPVLSTLFGLGSAKADIIPIDSPLKLTAGGIAFILSAFAFLFVFAKEQVTRHLVRALGSIGIGIIFFFIYWILRSYFGRNPPFISQGFTEAIMIILYALIFAFFTAGFTFVALKLYSEKERGQQPDR